MKYENLLKTVSGFGVVGKREHTLLLQVEERNRSKQ